MKIFHELHAEGDTIITVTHSPDVGRETQRYIVLERKNFAVVKVDGVIIRKLDLSVDETFTIETSGEKNIVAVKNGAVSVVETDCPDKICVRRGAIKNVGETIAFVPHKLLIEIAGD